mgnify:CR=1 FL=1
MGAGRVSSGRVQGLVEVTLEAAIIAVAWFVSLLVAILVVPRLAGKKARAAWTAWLMSPEADPYLDRVADRVEAKMEPRLMAFEEQLGQPIQLDLAPIVAMVTESVVPRVKEEVEKVRAVIDGKLGFARKVAKGAGEAITEAIAEEAAANVDPAEAEIVNYIDELIGDKEWTKEHPAAAIGLRILKRQGGNLTLQRGGAGFRRSRGRR